MSYQQMTYIRRRVYEILAEIRPIAVPLVDAFDFRDRQLNSLLGQYDGNVYESLLKWASDSPLNQKQVCRCDKICFLKLITVTDLTGIG